MLIFSNLYGTVIHQILKANTNVNIVGKNNMQYVAPQHNISTLSLERDVLREGGVLEVQTALMPLSINSPSKAPPPLGFKTLCSMSL